MFFKTARVKQSVKWLDQCPIFSLVHMIVKSRKIRKSSIKTALKLIKILNKSDNLDRAHCCSTETHCKFCHFSWKSLKLTRLYEYLHKYQVFASCCFEYLIIGCQTQHFAYIIKDKLFLAQEISLTCDCRRSGLLFSLRIG